MTENTDERAQIVAAKRRVKGRSKLFAVLVDEEIERNKKLYAGVIR